MQSTLIATFRNAKRDVPFIMWWAGVMATAVAQLIDGLVTVTTLGLVMPGITMRVLSRSIRWQLGYAENHRKG